MSFDDPTQVECDNPPPPSAESKIFGFVLYTNSRMPGVATGLPRATVYLFNSSGQVAGGPVLTPTSGYFEFTLPACPTGWDYYTIGAYTGNSAVAVRQVNQVGYTEGTSISNLIGARNVFAEDCNYQSDVGALSNEQAEAFDNLNETAIASSNFFRGVANRPKINARVRPDLGGTGVYSPHGDTIVLYREYLFGQGAVFGAGHEYGHAVHEKGLGGYSNYAWYNHYYGSNGCPNLHFLYTISPMFCAYVEGFATFHAIATRGSANPAWIVDSTNINAWWRSPRQLVPGDPESEQDGSLREGAVAAFLLDLIDGKSEDLTFYAPTQSWYDNVQLPTDFFARVMRSCRVEHWGNQDQIGTGTWDRANGVDFLFYCVNRNRERHRDTEKAPWTITNAVGEYFRTNLFRTRRTSGILYSWPTVQYPFYWWDETEYDDYPYRGGVPYPGYEWPYHQVDTDVVMRRNLYPQ